MLGRAVWDKLPEFIFENFEIARVKFFKNHEGDLSQKSPETTMWLLVNHTKPTKSLYWNWHLLRAGNYKAASGQLPNNTVNGAMSISINRVITKITFVDIDWFFFV